VGIETIELVPGTAGGHGNFVIHAGGTHSLLGADLHSILVGAVAAIPWRHRVGPVLPVKAH
jgi:hypothetical protein